ncbi:conserved unknown protein [Ectocarpus siliculosus]|uniref:N-acetyltransferase domain-containing protein n=1 Tax=Ectocarpus siliculosus TaxID=2880 RepID=D7FTU4_ECTSI|nr:conserved unknown protein [Ectocarpus siliculosus]|eukprot:CBJ31471.1 conserved unknown protein [Ectocarpus siliculosus]
MKTYSRRNSKPIARSARSGVGNQGSSGDTSSSGLTPSTPSSTPSGKLWGAGDPLSVGRKRRRPGTVKSTPTASSTNKKRSSGGREGGVSLAGKGKEQTFLDFGQRSLGERALCPRCNLLYVRGSADDEERHAALCAKAARGIDFAGWKQERVKEAFADDGGRVVEVREGDPAPHLAKLREVERLMDADMGFAPGARDDAISLGSGIDTARRAVVLPEPRPKKTELAAAVGSGFKPSVVAPPPLTRHFSRIGEVASSTAAAAASTGLAQRPARSFVAGIISGEHDPRPRQEEEQQAPRSAEGGRCCVSSSKEGGGGSSPARRPPGMKAAPPQEDTGSGASAGPCRPPSPLDGSSGIGGGEAGFVAEEEAVVTGNKRGNSDGGGGGSTAVAATAGCAAAATAGVSPSAAAAAAAAAAARSSLKRKKLRRGDTEGAPTTTLESFWRPNDFQDLRAWTAGKAASAEAAGRVGPVGDREARASCTSEAEGASEEKTMFPAVVGGRYSCGGGGGEGVRVAGDGPESAAGGGEGGGEGGGLRLPPPPPPPPPSVAGAPAAAAGAAEMKQVFVRISPWSRPPVVRAPAAGPARGGGAGPTPLAAESTTTAGTAVPSPRPKIEAAAGGDGLLGDSSGGGAAEGRDAGDRCHPSPRGAATGGGGGDGRTRHEADRHSGEARHPAHVPLSLGGAGTGGAGGPAEYGRGSESDHGTTGEDNVEGFSALGNGAGGGQEGESSRPPSPPDRRRRRRGPGSSPSWSGGSVDSEVSSPSPPPEEEEEEDDALPSPLPTTVLTCEDKETKAVVGILQVWVHERSRRQGVATRLVDTVREKMVYGISLRREEVAFSQPTREGQAFATRYTGGKGRLLVY